MTIAVIGLGGAGGNIANEASKLGLSAGAINFSQKDLDSLDNIKHKLKIMGSEGVGHNRDLAISLMQEHYEMVVRFVKENFSSPDISVIAFAFASSGGSGSGISVMLIDIMMSVMEDKTFIAIPIIPQLNESIVAQINSSNTFQELSKLHVCVFPIDNNKVRERAKEQNITLGRSKLYHETNLYIASKLTQIASYTERHSINGNFDRKDLTTLFSQRGIGIICEVEITQLPTADITPEGIAASIQESWDNSIFAEIEYDFVNKAGIIFDGQESLLTNFDNSLIFDKFISGTPMDVFEGNYESEGGNVLTILTGLPFCRSRFEKIDVKIDESKKLSENVQKLNEKHEYIAKSGDFELKIRENRVNKAKVSDILVKYRR